MTARHATVIAILSVAATALALARQAPQQQIPKLTVPATGKVWTSPDGTYGFSIDAWENDSWWKDVRVNIQLEPGAAEAGGLPIFFELATTVMQVTEGKPLKTEESQKAVEQYFQMLVNTLDKSPDFHEKLKESCAKQGTTHLAYRLVFNDDAVTNGLYQVNSNVAIVDVTDHENAGADMIPGPGVSHADADGAKKIFTRHAILATFAHEADHSRDGPGETWHRDPDAADKQGLAPLDENRVFADLGVPIVRPFYWQEINGQSVTPYNIYGHVMYDPNGQASTATPAPPTTPGGQGRYSPADRSALGSVPGHRCTAGASNCFAGSGTNDPDFDGIRIGDNCPTIMNPTQIMVCPPITPPAWAVPPSFTPIRWSDLRSSTFGSSGRSFSKGPQDFGADAPVTEVQSRRAPLPLGLASYLRPQALSGGVHVFVTSLGQSTGKAMQLSVVNQSGKSFHLTGGQLALEPVEGVTQRDVARELERLGGAAQSFSIDAYCLDFGKAVPAPGVVYRLAAPASQASFGPIREILSATRYLEWAGALRPDSDPVEYFHSIRQWAIWTYREKYDQRRFAAAFEEHARKNFAAAKRAWNAETSRALQSVIPGRWRDIQTVLAVAGVQ